VTDALSATADRALEAYGRLPRLLLRRDARWTELRKATPIRYRMPLPGPTMIGILVEDWRLDR
jgi:hypothetical protein